MYISDVNDYETILLVIEAKDSAKQDNLRQIFIEAEPQAFIFRKKLARDEVRL